MILQSLRRYYIEKGYMQHNRLHKHLFIGSWYYLLVEPRSEVCEMRFPLKFNLSSFAILVIILLFGPSHTLGSVDASVDTTSQELGNLTASTILSGESDSSNFQSGDLIWARRAGGLYHADAKGITELSDDSIVITGGFWHKATFGEGEINEIDLVSKGERDIFVARYNPDGTLAWATRAGGTGLDNGAGIITLSDDSIVLTGYFGGYDGGPATFGEGEANETVLVPDELTDMFIARYNPDGTLAWAKAAGGTRSEGGYGITALSDNSTVVTGYFYESATFGEGEANETILVSDGVMDNFVARYNPDGTLAWVNRVGGTGLDYGYGIITLSNNSVVVTGRFEDTVTFGKDEVNETVLVSEGWIDFFVARYNPDGTLVWAKSAGGALIDSGYGITSLSDDSLVVTGVFSESPMFGEGEASETGLVSEGGHDIFVARYNPDGTLVWAIRAGGTDYCRGFRVTTLSDDSVIVTGEFQDTATFGKGEPNESTLISAGYDDIFVARYNPDGTLVGANRSGGIYTDESYGCTILSDDSTVVTGSFKGSATFGEGELYETILDSPGKADIFIARFAP